MKTKRLAFLLLIFILFSLVSGHVYAQTGEELKLTLSRDFGYSSGTGRIQGTFSMHVSGPEDLANVVFYVDETTIGEDSEAPFALRFNTDSFSNGVHTLHAVGTTSTGEELSSNTITTEFVSAEEGWQSALGIIGPMLAIILIAVALALLIPMVLSRGKLEKLPLGARRNYGVLGGTICPKCSRPFALHIYGMNMVVGKLERCPYCGRWSLVHRVDPSMLRAAENAERRQAEGEVIPAESEEEKLRKALDDSRFQDD